MDGKEERKRKKASTNELCYGVELSYLRCLSGLTSGEAPSMPDLTQTRSERRGVSENGCPGQGSGWQPDWTRRDEGGSGRAEQQREGSRWDKHGGGIRG